MPKPLTVQLLQKEASSFAKAQSKHAEPSLFDVTDGKAVGTYLEHKFQTHLQNRYTYGRGNSAKGIDFPELGVDLKVRLTLMTMSDPAFAVSFSIGVGPACRLDRRRRQRKTLIHS